MVTLAVAIFFIAAPPISSYISLHSPISPCISPYLPISRRRELLHSGAVRLHRRHRLLRPRLVRVGVGVRVGVRVRVRLSREAL